MVWDWVMGHGSCRSRVSWLMNHVGHGPQNVTRDPRECIVHVTHKMWPTVSSDLTIHCTTFMGLRWRLRVVYRWASPLLKPLFCVFSQNSIALLANCVTVVVDRSIMSAKYSPSSSSTLLAKTNPPRMAISLR